MGFAVTARVTMPTVESSGRPAARARPQIQPAGTRGWP
jgi:hypothetical protein